MTMLERPKDIQAAWQKLVDKSIQEEFSEEQILNEISKNVLDAEGVMAYYLVEKPAIVV